MSARQFRETFLLSTPADTQPPAGPEAHRSTSTRMPPAFPPARVAPAPSAGPPVNAEWRRFFRKARREIRSHERASKAKAYDMSSVRAYPRWWKDASQFSASDGHGHVGNGAPSHDYGGDGSGGVGGDGDATGKRAIVNDDLTSRTIRRCAELEASLSAQFDEESLSTSARYYPALPIHRRESAPRDSAPDANTEHTPPPNPTPDNHSIMNLIGRKSNEGEAKEKNKHKNKKGGAFKSTELSKRWESISWPSVFDGTSTADCLFVRSALIRKDLLFTFDPCLADAGNARRVVPHSGVVTCIQDVQQYVLQHKQQQQEEQQQEPEEEELWVLKPSDASNAYGIHFFRTSEATQAAEVVFGSNGEENEANPVFVVQQYIRPLLMDGLRRRKFHIRTLMLCQGGPLKQLDVFNYRESRVLIASEEWTPRDLSNKWMHITNMSVNCQRPSYIVEEQNRSLVSVFGEERADKIHADMADVMKQVMQSIHSRAKKSQFMPLNGCYELFGLDFCIDTTDRVWLLEANPEPSIALFPGYTRDSILGENPLKALPDGWQRVWSSALFDAVRRLKR